MDTTPEIIQPQAPVAPGSLRELIQMANIVVDGGLFGYTDKGQDVPRVVTLMLVAQAEGLHPIDALRQFNVIKGMPSLKADAMLARHQRTGGKCQWLTQTPTECSAHFVGPLGELTVVWNEARARQAGLWGKENWQKDPIAMQSARCVSEGVRRTNPAAIQGFYTPEEVQDFAPKPEPQGKPAPKSQPPKESAPADSSYQPGGGTDKWEDQDPHNPPEAEDRPAELSAPAVEPEQPANATINTTPKLGTVLADGIRLAANIVYGSPITVRVDSVQLMNSAAAGDFAKIGLLFGQSGKWATMYQGWQGALEALGVDRHAEKKGQRIKLYHALAAKVTLTEQRAGNGQMIAVVDSFELLGKLSELQAPGLEPPIGAEDAPSGAGEQGSAGAGETAAVEPSSAPAASQEAKPGRLTLVAAAGLLYHVRRTGLPNNAAPSWGQAADELAATVKARAEAFHTDQWRDIEPDMARQWIDRYSALPDADGFRNSAGGRRFTEDDAKRWLNGEYDPALGDLGEAMSGDVVIGTSGGGEG